MIVVSDTTAITSLLKINRIEMLRDLFGQVLVPEGVRDELLKYHSSLPEFLQVRLVGNRTAVNSLRDEIDEGEAQAIILAEELQADALLIDVSKDELSPRTAGFSVWDWLVPSCWRNKVG